MEVSALITTTYKSLPVVRGDTLMLYFPLIHTNLDGSAGQAFTQADAIAFDALWTGRHCQVRAALNAPDPPLLDIPAAQITVEATATPPGLFVQAPASQTTGLPTTGSAPVFDVQLTSTSGQVWTIANGTLKVTADVTTP